MRKLKDLNIKVSLEAKLTVSIKNYFLRENGLSIGVPCDNKGEPNKDIMEERAEVLKKAEPLIEIILEDVKKWKEDGCP